MAQFYNFSKLISCSELIQYLNDPKIQRSLLLMKCCGKLLKEMQSELEDLDDSEKISELKQAVKERAEKKAKSVVVAGNRKDPYDLEKVLEELGELDSGTTKTKANSKKKGKKAKKKLKQNNKVEPNLLINELEKTKYDVVVDEDNIGKSEQEKDSTEKNTNSRQNSENGSKISISNVDGEAKLNLERTKDSNKENIPLEVLEYWENIERENQRQKETLGFMETLMKRCENLQIQNQNLEGQNQTLQVQNDNLQAHATNLEALAKIAEDSQLCKICMENEISFVFIPCGHLITCENCALSENLKNCPMCRKQITTLLKTYLS